MIPKMDVINELTPEQKIEHLREMLRQQLLERGGGTIPQSQRSASIEMDVSQPVLSLFLDKSRDNIDAATCIKLAKYLHASPILILQLAGHDAIASILVELKALEKVDTTPDPWVMQFARAIDELNADGKDTVLKNARSIARILKDAQERNPTIIGGEDEKPKKTAKPYHIRAPRKRARQ